MQLFLAGIVVAVAAIVPACAWFFYKKFKMTKSNTKSRGAELEELGRLTGELAHEIKNPLSTIKINLKLTAEELQAPAEGSSQRALRKIAVIRKEADRLEQILDDFLRYADRGDLQLEEIDLNALITDMIDFYSPQARTHNVTIRHGLCPDPLICKIDIDMLRQAILNLFINAQQAMDSGGELIIRTSRDKSLAVLEISDTGSGIPADRLQKIFRPYYSSRPHGSGLGLPTAKRIIDAHGGIITVNSETEKGTSFTIRLPLQR